MCVFILRHPVFSIKNQVCSCAWCYQSTKTLPRQVSTPYYSTYTDTPALQKIPYSIIIYLIFAQQTILYDKQINKDIIKHV